MAFLFWAKFRGGSWIFSISLVLYVERASFSPSDVGPTSKRCGSENAINVAAVSVSLSMTDEDCTTWGCVQLVYCGIPPSRIFLAILESCFLLN